MTLDAVPFLVIDAALAFLAWRRPWLGLVILLGVLPLNGALTQVVPHLLGLSDTGRLALAAWHDALVAGIALAAGGALLRGPDRRLSWVERLIGAILVVGAVYVVVSPVLMTAAYVYRVLYEPPLACAAITVLARTRGLPQGLPARAALAMVATTTLSALYTWPQVYLFRYGYLQTFYTEPGQQIHHSFLATGLHQPRGIGLLHSPNELGAALSIGIVLLVVPGLLPLRGWMRTWMLCALALALLLSFSRSGWLATAIGLGAVLLLARDRIPSRSEIAGLLRRPVTYLRHGISVALSIALAATVFLSSGADTLVRNTISGSDPSVSGRPQSVKAGLTAMLEAPLGLGLGTAGPKAARFGESSGHPRILTETWYLLYAIQVGIAGLGLLLATAAVILYRLWRDRWRPLSRAVMAIALGLGAGAVFIPIIEDPTIYTPLWTLTGLALAAGAARSEPAAQDALS